MRLNFDTMAQLMRMINQMREVGCVYCIRFTDYHDYAPDTIVNEVIENSINGIIINKDGTLMFDLDFSVEDDDTLYESLDEAAKALENDEEVKYMFRDEHGFAYAFNKTKKQLDYEMAWVEACKCYDDEGFDESNLD